MYLQTLQKLIIHALKSHLSFLQKQSNFCYFRCLYLKEGVLKKKSTLMTPH